VAGTGLPPWMGQRCHEEFIVLVRQHSRATALWGMLVALLAFSTYPAAAQNIGHFGKNRLEFAPVASDSLPDAMGAGIVDYEGGKEPESQWRASFRFTGLEANATYTVVIRGRFGDPGSAEEGDFTPLCSFTTDPAGDGSCFWYFRGLARLDLVQLRERNEHGAPVLEATRARGAGSIMTDPNRFSPGGENPPRKKSKNDRNSR
jgi:hypothetical protein